MEKRKKRPGFAGEQEGEEVEEEEAMSSVTRRLKFIHHDMDRSKQTNASVFLFICLLCHPEPYLSLNEIPANLTKWNAECGMKGLWNVTGKESRRN